MSENACTHSGKILCVPQGWENYISCEFHEIHVKLESLNWEKIVVTGENDFEVFGKIAHAEVVIFWELYEFVERNEKHLLEDYKSTKNSCKKIFFCDDVHYFTTHRQKQRTRAFLWADIIFATYPDRIRNWYPSVPTEKIVWMPHSAAGIFYPGNVYRLDKILLSGSRSWPYPFRQFCHERIPSDICDKISHPGYPGYPGDMSNKSESNSQKMKEVGRKAYGDLLRKYPSMIVCGSIFHYLVAKVFEGMASGCLVVCESASLQDDLSKLGFIDGKHYIGTSHFSVLNDVEKIKRNFFEKNFIYQEICNRALTMVMENHTTKRRAEQMDKFALKLSEKNNG
ncbi:glycosyltransferase [Robbsia sp. Bb-Pol-6]|uniref:Glycosyltransferase n=1 Tax=Robbsia betulipollinis TaxID=2981849 RepID=A0ABT3ZR44_9BURK|nr:glycosyltransferase [Robbsia betulipollinis]MCY0389018.1 glycosyltransferase [Robbsia betulipollinis]